MTTNPSRAIPTPLAEPLLGHMRQINPDKQVQSLTRLLQQHGPIIELKLPVMKGPGRFILVGNHALVDEICDERRFDKRVHPPLEVIRAFAGDGLFTAYTDEPNWQKAHNILMPAFGPLAIREMFPHMQDIAGQMLTRWERFGPEAEFDVADHMTRLTLDTIALCAFDTRFNSFYQNEMHPFVGAMVEALNLSSEIRPKLPLQRLRDTAHFQSDIKTMNSISDELIARRKVDPQASEKNDLLARMLSARDPQTGEGLSDENIRYQMATFLIAGHETTSGLLSFAIHALLKNPDIFYRARAEIDAVVGDRAIEVTDLPKLPYIEQILDETLRLWPTAPAFARRPYQKTAVGEHYEVTPDDTLMAILPAVHRDLSVWGPDVEKFDPQRFSPENRAALPPNAWKPFGTGQRACIGRPFAMQEAVLVLGSIIQRFDLTLADPQYRLKIKETLSLKPEGLMIRARVRGDRSFKGRGMDAVRTTPPQKPLHQPKATTPDGNLPLLVLYGSESGSCEAFAQRIGNDAAAQGYAAQVHSLDEQAGHLPSDGAVVIVTASYEGQPPANARQFVAWADTLGPDALKGVKYTVFGCGNRDWARTYQAIPKKLDTRLEQAGAQRVKARGEADARGDFFGDFENWYDTLWTELGAALGQTVQAVPPSQLRASQLQVEIRPGRRVSKLRQDDLNSGQVQENRELVNMSHPLARSKRHLEIKLPAGSSYRAGDYLAVLPLNPGQTVERVLKRFNLAADDELVVQGGASHLPAEPTSAAELLGQYVELAQPATRKQLEQLIQATRCPPEKVTLEGLLANYDSDVLGKRLSVLDLLERVQGCELPFADYLGMLPPLKPRQYSISSTPLWKDDTCTLTVAVVDAPALSGQGRFQGVTSTFLRDAEAGTRLAVAVRPSNTAFHPPADPATPIVMVCAGTGLAPFRGFVQERALQKAAGQDVGEALLFFGCDHPDVDDLYREELDAWEAQGVVSVRRAYTFDESGQAKPDGEVKFVQHRLWQDRADVARLFRQDARFYVCGNGRYMAPAVRETFIRIYQETAGVDEATANAWADDFERTSARYAQDVFA